MAQRSIPLPARACGLYQGLAIRPELSLPRCPGMCKTPTCSAKSVLKHKGKAIERGRTAMAGQMGNGLNVGVVGALCLANNFSVTSDTVF